MTCKVLTEIESREDRLMFSRDFSFTADQSEAANRLISVTYLNPQPPSVADNISFQYDGNDRRIGITEKHGATVITDKRFVWCGRPQPCEERDSTGMSVNKRFFDLGEKVSNVTYFYTVDHLGSVRELTDGSGNIQARYEYDSWGIQTKLGGGLESSFGYMSFYKNEASGLNLTWFRAYDPQKGRWLSRDPIEEISDESFDKFFGANMYAFADNDAIRFIDSYGLWTKNCARALEEFEKAMSNYQKRLLEMEKYKTAGQEFDPREKGHKVELQRAADRVKEAYASVLSNCNCKELEAAKAIILLAATFGLISLIATKGKIMKLCPVK